MFSFVYLALRQPGHREVSDLSQDESRPLNHCTMEKFGLSVTKLETT